MKKNEYNCLDDFLAEYTGKRDPANNQWYGLEFLYKGHYYRLDVSGGQFSLMEIIFAKGETYPSIAEYRMIARDQKMTDLLEEIVVAGKKFKEIIIDDETELLGKD